jgi:hypothetical protein
MMLLFGLSYGSILMAANWVIAAANIAGSSLDLLGTAAEARTSRTFGRINDELTRQQIAIASSADANARIRATGNLISAQRAALGASGVMGGRTARLLEARVRINAGREQRQANQSRVFRDTASRLGRIQNRSAARTQVWRSAQDLFVTALGERQNPAGNPGVAGDG